MERQPELALVAAARPVDSVDQSQRFLAAKAGPRLALEDPHYFGLIRKRLDQTLNEAESDTSLLVNQFQCRDTRFIDADLAVSDHPVASKLKPCDAIFRKAHPTSPPTR